MAQDINEEKLGQEEIDAILSSSGTAGQAEEKVSAASHDGNSPPKKGDEPKEIMTQEEIDAYIASVRAKEAKEEQEREAVRQQASSTPSEDPIDPPKDDIQVSQGDIDAMIAQQQQSPPPEQKPSVEAESAENISQAEIDSLIAGEPQPTPSAPKASAAVSQSDIDKMIAQKRTTPFAERGKNVWAELNQDLLSQEEIDALMSGFVQNDTRPSHEPDDVIDLVAETSEPPDSPVVTPPKHHIEIREEREEGYLQKKRQAFSLLKELMKSEEDRIRILEEKKQRMKNDKLYRRYEISRADRTVMVVSMSENNAEQYRMSHPGCCMHRI